MLTAEEARRELEYFPDTGLLFWRTRSRGRKIGTPAGTSCHGAYRTIKVLNRVYQTHRVIWLIVHGKWPDGQIDHINRCPSDNRICNLRDVTKAKNLANKGMLSNNTSGFKGVVHTKSPLNPWVAQIWHHGFFYLGCFPTPEEAHEAYLNAYHRFHGEHANLPGRAV